MVLDGMRPRLESRFGGTPPEPADRTEPGFAPAPAPVEPIAEEEPAMATSKTGHIILIGYGRVGSVVAETLIERGQSFLVIEAAEGQANAAKSKGIEVIAGNAAAGKALNLANVDMAAAVIIAISNAFEAGQATEQARKSNAKALIVAQAQSDEEAEHLKAMGANVVIMGEREIAMGIVDMVTRDSSAMAEITASDAVAAALGPLPANAPVGPKLATDPNILAEAIEAAHVQHPDTGPAEPPYVVSSLGEEPDRMPDVLPPGPEAPAVELQEEHPASELVVMTPDQRLAPLVPVAPRPAMPATQAGAPFNPEVPPPDEKA
jgi:CPA2 family monovalent cation:H+ antiporter-2